MDEQPNIMPEKKTALWAIIEIFGHKQIAGLTTPEEFLGKPMLRVDVPPVQGWPGFTRYLSPDAIYSLTYVSEDAGRLAAERIAEKPIAVFIPELNEYARAVQENEELRTRLKNITEAIQGKALPQITYHDQDEDDDRTLRYP